MQSLPHPTTEVKPTFTRKIASPSTQCPIRKIPHPLTFPLVVNPNLTYHPRMERDAGLIFAAEKAGNMVRLAEICGVTKQAAYQWSELPLQHVEAVCKALKVRPEQVSERARRMLRAR